LRKGDGGLGSLPYPRLVAKRESDPAWHSLTRDGVGLACADFGGVGPPVMLLHGLGGYAEEWAETASWLVNSHRVLAPDARGHGASERCPPDVSRTAHVGDVDLWVRHFSLAPVLLVGQSLGGHTAFLVAARRPELVAGLVVVEATPQPEPDVTENVQRWFESWPVPFPSRDAALAFFGDDTLWARAWVGGLEATAEGLRPRFEVEVIIASLKEVAEFDYWDEWRTVQSPTLVVRAESGVSSDLALRMIELQPKARLVEVADARHDVHLEQPAKWRRALESFLEERTERW
jgi:pimeloyl-ACP methyl ester carboxylesterase